jgi:hypothetical protein
MELATDTSLTKSSLRTGTLVNSIALFYAVQTSCKKQINKQNSYLLLAFLQSGSVPELRASLRPAQFFNVDI